MTQAAAIVWTVSMMMSDIESNSRDISSMNLRMARVENMVQSQAVSMARIDENIQHIRGILDIKMATN